jgi:hypothetical protein
MAVPAKPAIPEPPALSAAEQVQIWNAAHDSAFTYTQSLPDFICSEVIHRYLNPKDNGDWRLEDIARNTLLEFFAGQVLDQLRENSATDIHPPLCRSRQVAHQG